MTRLLRSKLRMPARSVTCSSATQRCAISRVLTRSLIRTHGLFTSCGLALAVRSPISSVNLPARALYHAVHIRWLSVHLRVCVSVVLLQGARIIGARCAQEMQTVYAAIKSQQAAQLPSLVEPCTRGLARARQETRDFGLQCDLVGGENLSSVVQLASVRELTRGGWGWGGHCVSEGTRSMCMRTCGVRPQTRTHTLRSFLASWRRPRSRQNSFGRL